MEYKGVEFSVVKLIEGSGFRWKIDFGGGKTKSGVTPLNRAEAIKIVEYEINRALKKEP